MALTNAERQARYRGAAEGLEAVELPRASGVTARLARRGRSGRRIWPPASPPCQRARWRGRGARSDRPVRRSRRSEGSGSDNGADVDCGVLAAPRGARRRARGASPRRRRLGRGPAPRRRGRRRPGQDLDGRLGPEPGGEGTGDHAASPPPTRCRALGTRAGLREAPPFGAADRAADDGGVLLSVRRSSPQRVWRQVCGSDPEPAAPRVAALVAAEPGPRGGGRVF